mgnify:CR=1 FL=1|tara:strand:- start:2037 stop:3200 length:1164 start_codon:yes stop_codon:yes gene_type:complete
MQLKKYLPLVLLVFGMVGSAQLVELSPLTKISILTVGPGDELNSKFGHSALRLQDPTIGIDVVYNYGLFDFEAPNFYVNFVRGQLDYSLGRQRFNSFCLSYEREGRWVKEQVLKLSGSDIEALFRFLEDNYLPENRYYKYDFFFDNCTTRIPDALQKVLNDRLDLDQAAFEKEETYRQLIHQNLEVNSWSNFGIDLALGSVIDKKGTPFLPINVFDELKNSKIDGAPLVYTEVDILPERRPASHSNFLLSPLFWLVILLLVVGLVSFLDIKNNKRTRWLDFTLFFVTGAAGLLILFLWFGTDHLATKINFNSFWAFAPNLAIAFYLLRKQPPPWTKKYLYVAIGFLVLTVVFWLLKIQIFSPLIIFILIALAIRYIFLVRYLKYKSI